MEVINDNTQAVLSAKRAAIQRALKSIGMQAEGYAKALCPVDTSNLRNSIANDDDGESTVVIGTNVEYAPYVEYGTSKMAERPYLRPAVENHIEEYKRMFEYYLQNA